MVSLDRRTVKKVGGRSDGRKVWRPRYQFYQFPIWGGAYTVERDRCNEIVCTVFGCARHAPPKRERGDEVFSAHGRDSATTARASGVNFQWNPKIGRAHV